MTPLRLSDAELDAIFAAAAPIAVDRREDFLQQVARSLQGHAGPGPGDIYRAIREAQRTYFDPPDLSRTNDSAKYR